MKYNPEKSNYHFLFGLELPAKLHLGCCQALDLGPRIFNDNVIQRRVLRPVSQVNARRYRVACLQRTIIVVRITILFPILLTIIDSFIKSDLTYFQVMKPEPTFRNWKRMRHSKL